MEPYSGVLRTYSGVLESYMQFFFSFFFLPITRVHGARVSKRHYRFLKRHYRLLKNVTIGLNSILRKSSFKIETFP